MIAGRKITRRGSIGSTRRVPSGVAPLNVSMMLNVSEVTEVGLTSCEKVTTNSWFGAMLIGVQCTSWPPAPLGQPSEQVRMYIALPMEPLETVFPPPEQAGSRRATAARALSPRFLMEMRRAGGTDRRAGLGRTRTGGGIRQKQGREL